MSTILEATSLTALAFTAYHHAAWPMALRALRGRTPAVPAALAEDALPSVSVVMPAYNEAAHIVAKLRNLAALDYPADRLEIIVACDGCTDQTAALARSASQHPDIAGLNIRVIEHRVNRGKVAVLNDAVASATGTLVALTDVSALLPPDCLRRAGAHFAADDVGAVGGTYRLLRPGSPGEAKYWQIQVGVKQGEAALGAPIGLHGAFYAFRRVAWRDIPGDTINDDFIVPMSMVRRGWKVRYDASIVTLEAERTQKLAEDGRRRRIGAGNVQQLIRCSALLNPKFGGVALAFASGKVLRAVMPLLIATSLAGSIALSADSRFFAILAALQLTGIALAMLGGMMGKNAPRLLAVAHYILAGHVSSAAGAWRYISGRHRQPWRRSTGTLAATHLPPVVANGKRAMDIAIAGTALVLTLPVWPLIALAIKLDSPGPVIFRQLRVGRALPDRTELFRMMKFRSMRADAEKVGAQWAAKKDNRVTRVGNFLRKTRLDELPQLMNVLRGEMSIVGPRPERPGFYQTLEAAIPFFAERTMGLRPGITGYAQVAQGYTASVEEARTKAAYDHAYALRLSGFKSWLVTDVAIAVRTVTVMVTGRGR